MFRSRKLRTPAAPTPAPVPDDPDTPTETNLTGETNSPRRRPRRYLVRRWAGLASAVVLLVGLTTLLGTAFAGPAAAGAFGMCDADMSIAAPIVPDAVATDAPYTKGTSSFGRTYTTIDGGQVAPADAYAGGGLKWQTFGLSSCGDAMRQAEGMMARDAYMALVQFPLQILGTLLQWAMSTAIGNMLLDAVLTPVTAMYDNIFLRWGVVVIMAVGVGALFMIARGHMQKGVSRFGWMIGVIVVIAGLASPAGLSLVRSTNDVTSTVSGCLAFGFTSGCATTGDSSTMYTASMEESFAYPVWAGGALGAKASQEIPDKLKLTGHDGVPAVHQDATFDVPKNIIPAENPGHPTWAEALRWTQTYTAAEVHAMADDASLRCGLESSIAFEALTDPNTKSWTGGGDLGQICSFKWVARAAIISNIYATEPGVYSTLRGANDDSLFAAISSIGIWPLVLGIGVVGLMTLFYQLELIALFTISPVVAVAALRSPETGKRWANQVLGTLVRRLAVGVTLGLILWLVQLIVSGMTNLSAHVVTRAVPPILQATIESILTIVAMIVGAAMFGKIKALMESTTGVEHDEQRDHKMRQVGSIAVGAAAGALGAGSGMRLMGAAQGLMRTGTSRGAGGNPVRAGLIGHGAGRNAAEGARRLERENAAAGTEPVAAPVDAPGPRNGDGTGARPAWDAIRGSEDAMRSRSAAVADAERRLAEADQRLAEARRRAAEQEAARDGQVRSRTEELVTGGATPAAALAQAVGEVDRQTSQLAAMVRRADDAVTVAGRFVERAHTAPAPLERELDRRARAGADPDETAAALGLSAGTAAAFAAYAQAVRQPAPVGGEFPGW